MKHAVRMGVAIAVCVAAAPSILVAGLIGGGFFQISPDSGAWFPDVAYDSVDGKYLVVYTHYEAAPAARIYGRFVSSAGAVMGDAFPITEPAGGLFAAVAYNAVENEFLVTWDDQRAVPFPIWGQRISAATGQLVGTNFQIGQGDGIRSAVAWSATSDSYLVAWWTSSSEIIGRRVNPNGTLAGSELNISHDAGFSGFPALTWGSNGNQYLVTWDNDYDLHGQRVNAATGALLGNQLTIGGTGGEDRSCIAYDSINSRWLVQSNSQGIPGNSYDQFAQLIDLNGDLVGGLICIACTTAFEGDTQFGGDVAFLPGLGRYFSSYGTDNGMGGVEFTAAGEAAAFPVALGDGAFTSVNNAADPKLNRWLTAWDGMLTQQSSQHFVFGRLYEAAGSVLPGRVNGPNPADAATGVDINADLSWTAGSNAVSHDVYFGTTNPPPLKTNQAGTTYDPGALAMSTAYYWRVNEVNGAGTTIGPLWTFATLGTFGCFSDTFSYGSGNLNGRGGWAGSAGSEILISNQAVRIIGGTTATDSHHVVNCADPGTGYIRVGVKAQAGSGSETSWALWIDDAAGVNMVRWYGSGASARGRVGSSTIVTNQQPLTGGWDDLVVKIRPALKIAEFSFNGGSIGTLDYSSQGAGNVVGRLRFERIASTLTAGQFVNLDDLTIGGTDQSVPPGQAANPSPVNGATDVSSGATLSWTAGANAASHTVYFGASNPPASRGTQTTTTFDPGALNPGGVYYWRIDEVNSSGVTSGALWSFTVSTQLPFAPSDFDQDGDVDQSDFGHLQECLSGTGVGYDPDCADTDLDSDGDIDTTDFNTFLSCLAGANQPPGC